MASIQPVAELLGHTDRVWACAWNPTKPLLASCSGDKSVRLTAFTPSASTSSSTFRHAHTLDGAHGRTVRSLDWRPDGEALATASFDSTVGIWERVRERGIDDGGGGAMITELDDGGNDDADADGEETWECATTLEGHESEVKTVRWSARGDLLATCGRDKSVWIWEATGTDFECLAVLMEHDQDVKAVAWHPTDEILASASYDDTIRLYRADLGSDEWAQTHQLPAPASANSHHAHAHAPGEPCSSTPVAKASDDLGGHTSTVWSCVFDPSGEHLASCSADKTVRIWSRRMLQDDELPSAERVFRIGASEKERWSCTAVLSGYHDREVYSVDWTEAQSSSKGPAASLGWLASAGGDGRICVFELTSDGKGISHSLLASIQSAHGVADVNCVSWCRLRPPARRRGGESDDGMSEDEDGPSAAAAAGGTDSDGRYAAARRIYWYKAYICARIATHGHNGDLAGGFDFTPGVRDPGSKIDGVLEEGDKASTIVVYSSRAAVGATPTKYAKGSHSVGPFASAARAAELLHSYDPRHLPRHLTPYHSLCIFCSKHLQRREAPTVITLLCLDGVYTCARLAVGECRSPTCGAPRYYPDRITYQSPDGRRMRYINDAQFLHCGDSLYISREWAEAHEADLYFKKTSFLGFRAAWNSFWGVRWGLQLSHDQLWRLFVEHHVRELATARGDEAFEVPGYSIDARTLARLSNEAAMADGFLPGAKTHRCLGCHHRALTADPANPAGPPIPVDPLGDAYVDMIVFDGICMGPRICAELKCRNPLVNYNNGRFCRAHLDTGSAERCGIVGCDAPCEPGSKVCSNARCSAFFARWDRRFGDLSMHGLRRVIRHRNVNPEAWHANVQPAADDIILPPGEPAGDAAIKHTFRPRRVYAIELMSYPCGHAIAFTSMYDTESDTQLVTWLDRLFPNVAKRPTYVVYDRACQLLAHLAHQRIFAWASLSRFIVDSFHYTSHSAADLLCRTRCNPAPAYPADTNLVLIQRDDDGQSHFSRAFNTEAVEELNAFITGFEATVNKFVPINNDFFLAALLNVYNKRTEPARRAAADELAERSPELVMDW